MRQGVQRIAYEPRDLQSGKTVVVKILDPNFTETDVTLLDSGKGIYYKDLNFTQVGPYFMRVFVNGQYVGHNKLRVERSNIVIPYVTELEDV